MKFSNSNLQKTELVRQTDIGLIISIISLSVVLTVRFSPNFFNRFFGGWIYPVFEYVYLSKSNRNPETKRQRKSRRCKNWILQNFDIPLLQIEMIQNLFTLDFRNRENDYELSVDNESGLGGLFGLHGKFNFYSRKILVSRTMRRRSQGFLEFCFLKNWPYF